MIEFDEAPLRPFHRRLALASTAGVFADGYGLGIIGIALSLAAEPLALDALWIGLIGGGSLAGLFLGALLTGPAADRYGRRPVFAANMAATAVLALLQFWIVSAWQLLVLRLAIGFLLGTDYVVSKALLIEFVPRRVRGRLLGTLSIAWAGGYACAYAVGFALTRHGPGAWRWMLLTSAVPCLAIVPLRLSMPESPLWLCRQQRFAEASRIVRERLGADVEPPPRFPQRDGAASALPARARWRELFAPAWRRRSFVGCMFFACQVMPYFAVGTFVAQLMAALHLQAGYFGGLLYNLALLGGAVVGLSVVDRLPRRAFLIGSFLASGLAMAILTAWSNLGPVASIALFAVFAGVLSAASNMVYVYLPELFPTELRASGIGLAIAASRVGSAISTFLLPLVVAHYGVRSALGACVAVLALGALVCQRWAPETRHLRLGALSMAAGVPAASWLASVALLSMAICPRALAAAPEPDAMAPFRFANAGIAELRAAMAAGELSAEQLVRYHLQRIERFDQRGPHLNTLLTLNPAALEQAQQLDRTGRSARGPLSGIPFIVKDNFDTADLPTSGGSAALRHSQPARTAFVVQRLLDQGAILIGKANMSELAASYGRLGYSSAGGLTLNPYNTRRDASGSSSGSAAAIAADFATFALGTDASGSVRAPASVTGLVGIRPTLGLVSRDGIMPSSLSFDTAGVLARSVDDAARVLSAIAGADRGDAATLEQPAAQLEPAPSPKALAGLRLGLISNFRGGNDEIDRLEQRLLQRLRQHGAVLVPLQLPGEFEHLWESVLAPVSEAEFKPQFERYLASLSHGGPRTLAELIAMSASPAIADSATPVNPARLDALRRAEATQLTDSPLYIRILTQQMPALRTRLRALMRAHRLDAFLFATMSCPASPRFDQPDPDYQCRVEDPYRASYIGSATGFPEISVPMGQLAARVPAGISLLALPYQEPELLALARALQTLLPPRPIPELH